MCGRFALSSSADELIREFVSEGGRPEDWWPGWEPKYSIAPTDRAPVARTHDGARELEMARWDWPKPANRPKGAPIINARIEKLLEAFWRTGFTRSRCLVPMTGYFEWTGEKGDKTPHYIHGRSLLAAAGMTRLVEGEPRFVVITREGRMPLARFMPGCRRSCQRRPGVDDVLRTAAPQSIGAVRRFG